jgi:integrase
MKDGHLYRRGVTWWCCLWRDGRRIRESLKTDDRDLAEKRFARLKRARERGEHLAPRQRRINVAELLDDLAVHLAVKAAASAKKAASHMKPLRRELGHLKAAGLETARVERLQAEWLAEGLAPATVNRRCELLRQAFRLAARRAPAKVAAVPLIPALPVDNARQGFLSRADFDALVREIADPDVADFVAWSFWTGMRPGETRQLTWTMWDREAQTLTLHPAADKIRRGRVLGISGPLAEILERRQKRRRLECPLIFHRELKGRAGQPVLDFRKAWKAALRKAGLPPGLTPYDLRRTALRNMIRAGTDVSVAMKISGHRTRSTFDRYNIVDERDVREAVVQTAAHVAAQPKRRRVARMKKRTQ